MSFMGINFGFHNMMTCGGWATHATALGPVSFDIGSPCSMSKLGLVLLFFIVAIARKWGGEEIGIAFDFWWAIGLSLGAYILAITFTGSTQFAMLLGIIGMIIGGYLMGFLMGGGDNYGE